MNNSQLTISKIDASESVVWDKYIQDHKGHTPYHLFAWLSANEAAYSHQVYYFMAKIGTNVVGVLPLVNIRIPFKGSSLCSLPFCDVGGCLADNEEIKLALELEATKLKQQLKAKTVEYRERIEHSENADMEGKKVSMLLPLPTTSEALFSGFKAKLRSQIRKAEKNNLTCELGRGQEFIDDFYAVFSENMLRLGSPVHSKKWIESICEQYDEKCIIAVVKLDGEPVGAGIVLFSNRKACIPWASTRVEYNRLSPNMMLYWALLKFVTDEGCEEFDFGRSTYNEGTYRFKRQWGAEPVLLEWRNGDVPVDMKAGKEASNSKVKSLVESLWKKLPLSVANILGPKLRRFISL